MIQMVRSLRVFFSECERNARLALSAIVTLALVATASSFVWIQARHVPLTVFWDKAFEGASEFGQSCEGAVGVNHQGAAAGELAAAPLSYLPLPMPLKIKNQTMQLHVSRDGYLVVRCQMPTSVLKPTSEATLRLGRLFGDSAVYINGELRATVNDERVVSLALEPKDLGKPSLVTVVSRPTPPKYVAGLLSSDPLVVTDRKDVIQRIDAGTVAPHTEIPVFRWGVGTVFTLLFGLAWVFGLRSRDVTWMVVLGAAFTLQNALWFSPSLTPAAWQMKAFGMLEIASGFALAGFVLGFMRLPQGSARIESLLLSLLAIYCTGYWVLPDSFTLGSPYRLSTPYVAGGLALVLASGVGFTRCRVQDEEAGRRTKWIALLGMVAALAYLSQFVASLYSRVYVDYVKMAFLMGFSGWLGADLMVFRRAYFEEKAARAKAESESERAQMMSWLLQVIVHDLNRPFNAMTFAVDSLGYATDDPERVLEVARQLAPTARAAKRTVARLLKKGLDITRGGLGERETTQVETLATRALQEVFDLKSASGIAVEMNLKDTEQVIVDKVSVLHAIENIVANAVEAMDGKGKLWLRATVCPESSFVSLEIGNDGPMIPASDVPHLFTPFYTRGKAGGTGLGLYGVKLIVERHGGQVGLRSNESETVFTLTLPTEANGEGASLEPSAPLPERAGKLRLVTSGAGGVP